MMVVRREPSDEQLRAWAQQANATGTIAFDASDLRLLTDALIRTRKDRDWWRERATMMNKKLDPYGDRGYLERAIEA